MESDQGQQLKHKLPATTLEYYMQLLSLYAPQEKGKEGSPLLWEKETNHQKLPFVVCTFETTDNNNNNMPSSVDIEIIIIKQGNYCGVASVALVMNTSLQAVGAMRRVTQQFIYDGISKGQEEKMHRYGIYHLIKPHLLIAIDFLLLQTLFLAKKASHFINWPQQHHHSDYKSAYDAALMYPSWQRCCGQTFIMCLDRATLPILLQNLSSSTTR